MSAAHPEMLGLAQGAPRLAAPRAGVFPLVRLVLVFPRAEKRPRVRRVDEGVAEPERDQSVAGRSSLFLRGEEAAERLAALAHGADPAQARELLLPVRDVEHAPQSPYLLHGRLRVQSHEVALPFPHEGFRQIGDVHKNVIPLILFQAGAQFRFGTVKVKRLSGRDQLRRETVEPRGSSSARGGAVPGAKGEPAHPVQIHKSVAVAQHSLSECAPVGGARARGGLVKVLFALLSELSFEVPRAGAVEEPADLLLGNVLQGFVEPLQRRLGGSDETAPCGLHGGAHEFAERRPAVELREHLAHRLVGVHAVDQRLLQTEKETLVVFVAEHVPDEAGGGGRRGGPRVLLGSESAQERSPRRQRSAGCSGERAEHGTPHARREEPPGRCVGVHAARALVDEAAELAAIGADEVQQAGDRAVFERRERYGVEKWNAHDEVRKLVQARGRRNGGLKVRRRRVFPHAVLVQRELCVFPVRGVRVHFARHVRAQRLGSRDNMVGGHSLPATRV